MSFLWRGLSAACTPSSLPRGRLQPQGPTIDLSPTFCRLRRRTSKREIDGTRRRRAIELIASEETPSMRVTVTLSTPLLSPYPAFHSISDTFLASSRALFPFILSSSPTLSPRLSFARGVRSLGKVVMTQSFHARNTASLRSLENFSPENFSIPPLSIVIGTECLGLSNSISLILDWSYARSENGVIFFSESPSRNEIARSVDCCWKSSRISMPIPMIGYLRISLATRTFEVKTTLSMSHRQRRTYQFWKSRSELSPKPL